MKARMRDDLAEDGLAIPASRTFKDYDTQVDVVYVNAEELVDAVIGNDSADPDDHAFCYVQLKDGRALYFLSVDLDFEETT
jgi:hypothetical protein